MRILLHVCIITINIIEFAKFRLRISDNWKLTTNKPFLSYATRPWIHYFWVAESLNTRVHNYPRHIAEGANSWVERGHMYNNV